MALVVTHPLLGGEAGDVPAVDEVPHLRSVRLDCGRDERVLVAVLGDVHLPEGEILSVKKCPQRINRGKTSVPQ